MCCAMSTPTGCGAVTVPHPQAQLEVGTLQSFLDEYTRLHGGRVDYIHGAGVTRELSLKPGNLGFPAARHGQAAAVSHRDP